MVLGTYSFSILQACGLAWDVYRRFFYCTVSEVSDKKYTVIFPLRSSTSLDSLKSLHNWWENWFSCRNLTTAITEEICTDLDKLKEYEKQQVTRVVVQLFCWLSGLRAPTGLPVPAHFPRTFSALPVAQGPFQAPPRPGPSVPAAAGLQLPTVAQLSPPVRPMAARPWPVPIPREVPGAPGGGCPQCPRPPCCWLGLGLGQALPAWGWGSPWPLALSPQDALTLRVHQLRPQRNLTWKD